MRILRAVGAASLLLACSSNGGSSGQAVDGGSGSGGFSFGGGPSGGAGLGGFGVGGSAGAGASSGGSGASGGASAGGGFAGSGGGGTGGASGNSGSGSGGTGGVNQYCGVNPAPVIHPGTPFTLIAPIASGYLDAEIEFVREAPGGAMEAVLEVDHCAVLSATDSVTDDSRISFDPTGKASSVDKFSSDLRIDTQGVGVFVFDPAISTVALYASQDLSKAPTFTKVINSSSPVAVKHGGFLVSLWNGKSATAFTWGSITMKVKDSSGYLAKASNSGALEWAYQIENGSAEILAVDDAGASVLRVGRSGSTSVAAVTMNGTELIATGPTSNKCTLVQVSAAGKINWIKHLPACSDWTNRWALSPKSQELHVVSKANVDWGSGTFSKSSLEHVLTKFDALGKLAWQKSIVKFSSNITSYGFPWLIVAEGNIPIVRGYLEGPMSFAGSTLQKKAGSQGMFVMAFEPSGAPRWLSGMSDCSDVNASQFSPFTRVGAKVAFGAVVSNCMIGSTTVGAGIPNVKGGTSNLVVLTP